MPIHLLGGFRLLWSNILFKNRFRSYLFMFALFSILFTHITNVIEQQGHVHKIVQFPPAFWIIPMILPGTGDMLVCTWCRTAGKYGRKPANIICKSARDFCFGAQTTHDTCPQVKWGRTNSTDYYFRINAPTTPQPGRFASRGLPPRSLYPNEIKWT